MLTSDQTFFQQPANEGNQKLALDENIYELRKEKLKQIEALGGQAYPYTYDPTHTLPDILAQYGESTGEQLSASRVDVRAAGRIMAIRTMGKAAFVHLQQRGRQLQLYIKKDAVREKWFELY
jgi:lysyl-tRNA synthetase class 2